MTTIRFLVSLLVILGGCAESHCREPGARDTGGSDAPETGPVCTASAGHVWVGPIVSGRGDGEIGCGRQAGGTIYVTLLDRTNAIVEARVAHCSASSNFVDLGMVEAGAYRLVVLGDATVGAGARASRPAYCSGAIDEPVWCEPLDVVVTPCGRTVVPVAMWCDPAVVSDCPVGA